MNTSAATTPAGQALEATRPRAAAGSRGLDRLLSTRADTVGERELPRGSPDASKRSDAPRRPRVVIVGGGFGGLATARTLARSDVDITLVDRTNHHLFQPLLYQVAIAGLSPSEIAAPIRSILRRQPNVSVMLAEVVGVDFERRRLRVTGAELEYDFLVLAAGGRTSYFGHDEWAAVAPGLKDLDDALDIRRRVLMGFERAEKELDPARRRAQLTFVVVGAGPTGVELAGAIAELARFALARDFRSIDPSAACVLLLEGGPRVLPTFSPKLSERAARQLARLGVKVRLDTRVTSIDASGVQTSSDRIDADTVIWAAGVGGSPLAASLGVPLDRAGRVLVEPDLSLPGHPEVFAIGDMAAFLHQGGTALPGVSPVAMQMGRHAARCIRARLAGGASSPFRYTDRGTLATIGRSAAVAKLGRLELSGWPAWIAWLFIHIYFLIGFRNRVVVLLEWAWAYFTYQRGARLITGRKP
ncbi:MAG: NAD(P)/FAD-dependent oxidoreductase [Planctomycetes bacterium]|nr:NAD(P)/FAD-dependent oxidoreductase [Planctomycetota bacterium]